MIARDTRQINRRLHYRLNALSVPARHTIKAHCVGNFGLRKFGGRAELLSLRFKGLHVLANLFKVAATNISHLRERFNFAHGIFKFHSVFYRAFKRSHKRSGGVDCVLEIAISIGKILLSIGEITLKAISTFQRGNFLI